MLTPQYGQHILDQQIHSTCFDARFNKRYSDLYISSSFYFHLILFQFYVKFTIFRTHEQSHLDLEWWIQKLFKNGILSQVILQVVSSISCFASFGKEVRRNSLSKIKGSGRKGKNLTLLN